MNSMWKRSFALLLSLVMVFGMVPVNAFAEDTAAVTCDGTAECQAVADHAEGCLKAIAEAEAAKAAEEAAKAAAEAAKAAEEAAAKAAEEAAKAAEEAAAKAAEEAAKAAEEAANQPSVCNKQEDCPAAENHAEDCLKAIADAEAAKAAEEAAAKAASEAAALVCDGTENCAAETHETTCECYDWCAALGCSWEVHHDDCPWGPCTLTEGCELVKNHPGECTGAAVYDASNITTATELINAVANGGEITLGADITLTEVILLSKSVTINGNGHKISSSATRVFRLTTENIEVTMNNVNMVNTAVRSGSNDIRGVSIDDNAKNAKLTLNSCSVDFKDDSAHDWSYAVNDVGSNNCVITISGGSYEGANVFNIRGNNHTINISGVYATSLYKPNGAYMGVVVKLIGSGSTVTISNSTFNGGHAKAFEENNSGDNDVTFTGLTNNLKYYIVMIGSSYYYTLEEVSNQEEAATLINPYTLNGEAAFSSIAVSDFAKQNGLTRTITLGENGVLKVTEIDSDDGVKIVAKDVNSKVVYKDGAYRAVAKDRVASIGDVVYESLPEAVAAAADGDTITVMPGTYTMVNTTKKLTFKGESRTETVFDFTGADYTSIAGVNDITFENLTINRGGAYYRGFYESAKETYKDCDIKGVIWTYAKEANFIGCTFNQDAVEYNIWTYSAGKVNFTDCTFNCVGKSVLVYNEGAGGTEVNVTNCKFVASQSATGKAAIEIDSSLLKGDMFVVNIDAATTATGFDKGSVSGNTLWNNKKGVLTEVNAPEVADLSITYEAVAPQIQIDETKVDPAIADSIDEVEVPRVEGLTSENNEAAVKEAISQLTQPAASLKVTTSVTLSATKTADGKTTLTFDVTPVVQAKNANGDVVASAEITNLAEEITFHLPVPKDYAGTHVTIYHKDTYLGVYPVNQEGKYVEVKSKEFSPFSLGLDENAVPVASLNGVTYPSLQAAVDEASKTSGEHTITLIDNVTEDVTIKQTAGVNLIIDGAGKTFTGMLTIDGQKRYAASETLEIMNVNFVAPAGAGQCILSPRNGVNDTSYSHNVTISYCTFGGGSKNATFAIRHETGNDTNWKVDDCTFGGDLYGMLWASASEGVEISNCKTTVPLTEGISLTNSTDVTVSGNTIEATLFAVRIGATGDVIPSENILNMNDNVLTATGSNGSAVVIRGTAGNATVNMESNVVSGATHISGTIDATKVNADENYWDGKNAPVVSGTKVPVASYYEDAKKTSLKPTTDAVAEVEKAYFLTFEEAIAAAGSTKTIVLRKNVPEVLENSAPIVFTAHPIKVDLNGHKLRASFEGTIIMNKGTYNDANIVQFKDTGKPMIAPLGTEGYDFLSNNGVFEVSSAGINIVSGYVTLGQPTGTQIGHALTVKKDAKVLIPKDMNLALRGAGVVDGGELTVEGAIMLEAGIKDGTAYSATLKAPAGLNVIVCNCGKPGCDGSGLKVEYINGYYKLVTNDVAAYIGDKTYTDLNTAINDAADSATIVLVEDADIGNTTVNKNIALNLNGNKLVGNILVSSGKSVKIDTVNKNNVPYGIVLDGGDSVVGSSDGKLTVTAAKDTNSNYGSFLITKPDGANKTIARKVFLKENAAFVAGSTTSFDVTKADFTGEYMLDKDGNGIISKTDIYSEFLNAAGNPMYAPNILMGEKVTIKVRNSAFLDTCTQIYVNNERVYNKQANIPTVNTSVKVYVGCTELELTADYVKNLPAGTHSVKFYHTIDGTDYITESKFTVYTVYNANADTTNPKTGDEIFVPMFVMFSTAAALAVLVMGKKKYF